ncbi:hypothetical protein WICPIJ_009493 [Wickerhamomyces pijperi]|uniref:Uncharacterized protein n=1 Tax=Wickerhamomyces pijperi TaxID=599730 RepID=A0A9P8TD55_WICPI|nr:hypothetical protein WICPIJ_009493 [Wickerhamomyces pijperi]
MIQFQSWFILDPGRTNQLRGGELFLQINSSHGVFDIRDNSSDDFVIRRGIIFIDAQINGFLQLTANWDRRPNDQFLSLWDSNHCGTSSDFKSVTTSEFTRMNHYLFVVLSCEASDW